MRSSSPTGTGDHPRSRGVYRGIRSLQCAGGRIIPARAGFTSTTGRSSAPPWDHPRSRGVYQQRALHGAQTQGSSPLARGLPPAVCVITRPTGIIPARAGFTPLRWRECTRIADHPRSRGVYHSCSGGTRLTTGSSPLARGLRRLSFTSIFRSRIIPARAGFTNSTHRLYSNGRDHPRSRGVYRWTLTIGDQEAGSSPLARGLLAAAGADGDAPGIIPAHAGFTRSRVMPRPATRDHPRSRGVYLRRP